MSTASEIVTPVLRFKDLLPRLPHKEGVLESTGQVEIELHVEITERDVDEDRLELQFRVADAEGRIHLMTRPVSTGAIFALRKTCELYTERAFQRAFIEQRKCSPVKVATSLRASADNRSFYVSLVTDLSNEPQPERQFDWYFFLRKEKYDGADFDLLFCDQTEPDFPLLVARLTRHCFGESTLLEPDHDLSHMQGPNKLDLEYKQTLFMPFTFFEFFWENRYPEDVAGLDLLSLPFIFVRTEAHGTPQPNVRVSVAKD